MLRPTITMAALLTLTAVSAGAQDRDARERAERERAEARGGTRIILNADESERAVLGLNTSSSGDRDTLGLLITSITPGGPAEQAGLEEGNRIAAINGVNLRLSREDAGERDMAGLVSRRLTREMRKVKAGDQVTLRVWQNGAYREVRVKTVAAETLSPRRTTVTRESLDARPVLGISLSSSGSRRDSLGVLVIGVDENGPAEKAGLIEGDRIQSINGVNLRTAGEDAGDQWVSQARASRLRRELAKAKVGEAVELRVWSGGQVKSVRVTPVRADSLNRGQRSTFYFRDGAFGNVMVAPMAPVPPMPPMPPMAPMPGRIFYNDGEHIEVDVDRAVNEAMIRAQEALERVRIAAPEIRARILAPAPRVYRIAPQPRVAPAPAVRRTTTMI